MNEEVMINVTLFIARAEVLQEIINDTRKSNVLIRTGEK
jgi:hypothetical protein